MTKVGHAFSDYVISDNPRIKRFGRQGISHDFLAIVPLCILAFIGSLLLLRLFYIQILRGEYYKALSDTNRTRTIIIPASRGIIFDRKNKPLVRNSPAFKVVDSKTKKVEWIEKDEALKRMAEGKKVENDITRDYVYKNAFAHVLGYVGQVTEDDLNSPSFQDYAITDFTGKMGIEKEYEGLLHGKNGKELYEVDAQGKTIRFLGKEEPQAGQDIITTLDTDLQIASMDALKDIKKGAVIVSSAQDGGILALYSKPSFDPNLFTHPEQYQAQGEYKTLKDVLGDTVDHPFLNRVIGGVYPPGSTFKLITATAGLENKSIKADTVYEDTGILKVGAFSFGNWYFLQYGRTEGPVDVVKAIKRSNDIYFYKTAEGLGVDKLAEWAKKFGVGSKLNIDLPGEAVGTVPNEEWKKEHFGEQWYLGDTYHYGIGQGFLLTTPLQVNFWTLPFANDGTLYQPHILRGLKEVIHRDFIKEENVNLVRQGMKESCETGGVAWPFFDFKVKNEHLKLDGVDYTEDASAGSKMVRVHVGCKTGTAETDKDHNPHAWITVIAPYSKPEVVVTVLVEQGGEGSSIAGPIAKKVLEKYFMMKNE